jgi:hypothetical protein
MREYDQKGLIMKPPRDIFALLEAFVLTQKIPEGVIL